MRVGKFLSKWWPKLRPHTRWVALNSQTHYARSWIRWWVNFGGDRRKKRGKWHGFHGKNYVLQRRKGVWGFRDLKAFNLALLAKQGWRIQQNPISLIHRVFKVKYFAGIPFKEIQLGNWPSYAWRSIMAAKNIIVKNSRWTTGNGKRVHILEDRWLPTPESFKVVSSRGSHTELEMVLSLIDIERRGWNVAMVKNIFLSHEVDIILGISISSCLPNDSLIWA